MNYITATRQNIETLIKGSFVPYELMTDPLISQLGSYIGGFKDDWEWYPFFPDSITTEELLEAYNKLKGTK